MLQIRHAEPADAVAISTLVQQLTLRYITPDCTEEGTALLLKSMSAEAIGGYIQQSHFDYLLGEVDGELVAVVATRDNSHLYHLFVASHCQGRGYAGELWTAAKTRCLQRANTRVFTVNASLAAVAVYQRFGFVVVAGRREAQGIVDVPMQLLLSDETATRAEF